MGICPGVYVRWVFVRWVFVLIPIDTVVLGRSTGIVLTKSSWNAISLIEHVVPTKFEDCTGYQPIISLFEENIAKTKCLTGQLTVVVVLGLMML